MQRLLLSLGYTVMLLMLVLSITYIGLRHYLVELDQDARAELISSLYSNLTISHEHELLWQGTTIHLRAQKISWQQGKDKVIVHDAQLQLDVIQEKFIEVFSVSKVIVHIKAESSAHAAPILNYIKLYQRAQIISIPSIEIYLEDISVQARAYYDGKHGYILGDSQDSYFRARVDHVTGHGYLDVLVKRVDKFFGWQTPTELQAQLWINIQNNTPTIVQGQMRLLQDEIALSYTPKGIFSMNDAAIDGMIHLGSSSMRLQVDINNDVTSISAAATSLPEPEIKRLASAFDIPIDSIQGMINGAHLTLHHHDFSWKAQVEFEGFNYAQGRNRVIGLQGSIQASSTNNIRVHLDSDGVTLNVPEVFPQQLAITHLGGYVDIGLLPQHVMNISSHLLIKSIYGNGQIGGKLNIPLDQDISQSYLDLSLMLKEVDLQYRNIAVPLFISKPAYDWIQSHQMHSVLDVLNYVYRGNFIQGDLNYVSRVVITSPKGSIKFSEAWPPVHLNNINVHILDDRTLYMNAKGTINDAQISRANVEVTHDNLIVKAIGVGSGDQLVGILGYAGIPDRVIEGIKHLDIQNSVAVMTDIAFPLDDISFSAPSSKIKVTATLKNNKIHILPKAQLEGVSGEILYHNHRLSINNIVATLLGVPVDIDMHHTEDHLLIDVGVSLPSQKVVAIFTDNPGIAQRFGGISKIQVKASFGFGRVPENHYTFSSNLQGVKIDLASVYQKSEETILPWKIEVVPQNNHYLVTGNIGEYDYQLAVSTKGELQAIGWQDVVPKVYYDRLNIAARVSRVVFEEYRQLYDLIKSKQGFTHMDISADIGTLFIHSMNIDDIQLKYHQNELDSLVVFQSKSMKGSYYQPLQEIPKLDLQYLFLESESNINHMSFRNLPHTIFSVQQLMYGKQDWGSWSGIVGTDKNNQTVFDDIRGRMSMGLRVDKGSFIVAPSGSCNLKAKFSFGDIAPVIKFFLEYTPITSDRGVLDGNFRWLNCSLGLQDMQADIDIKLFEGATGIDLDDDTRTALGILGLFNIDNWTHLLSFNFTTLIDSGSYYEKIDGKFSIKNGIAYTKDIGLQIKMPSALFSYHGKANLLDNTIDGKVDLSLSLGKTLPVLVGALAGGLPAALALYEFGPSDILARFVKKRYQINGSLDQPHVVEISNK